jgi:DNA gyrase subunit A
VEGAEALTGGRIEERELTTEMRSSYLDYAMSVIVGRALPDVRDGLKPVHRRVLYAMHDLALQPNRPYRKSAFIVGEVMGKYHPHGDSAIYDTLARMAQPFSLRYMLVDGQGNFGSIDDDPPAAMRYTEARLARLSTELLRDIDADTVEWGPNYDESQQEPLVLPARFPNLLVNGSSGIAVGMATNIPPHNLSESIGAVKAYIANPGIDLAGLMEHVKGPDFPGGGIMSAEGVADAYASGRASVRIRARAHVEPLKGGRDAIIVTELPFMVKKGGEGGLITKIADLVRDKKITGISDLRDESDRNGMRLVIETKRGGDPPEVVLNQLYKRTAMQSTFGINMVALVDGVPKTLGLKELIEHYVNHQREVVIRRTQFELRRAEARAHILEGLLIALDNLDAVIELIRGSADTESAKTGLIERFELSAEQAQAILDMRLARLTALESDKLREEHEELAKRIAELRAILGDPARIDAVIVEELDEVDQRYGDERRTEVTHFEGDMNIEDMIADQQMVISITHSGYAKRLPLATYRQQHRGGRGVMGMDLKEDDYIEHLHICSTHDFLLFFTNRGKVYRLKVYELPEGARTAKGRALVNVLPLRDGEKVTAVIPTRDFSENKYLVFATAQGLVKKTEFKAYNTPIRADGIIAIKIRDSDELVQVRLTSGEDDILLVSKSGHASRFSEEAVRPMGRDTSGVKGMNVSAKVNGKPNRVLAMDIARDDSELFVVTENGYGKRTSVAEYPIKGRGTKGVLTAKLTEKKGGLAGALIVREHQDLLFISQNGMVQRTRAGGISQMGRPTQGVRVMNMKDDDCVSAVALVVDDDSGEWVDGGQGELAELGVRVGWGRGDPIAPPPWRAAVQSRAPLGRRLEAPCGSPLREGSPRPHPTLSKAPAAFFRRSGSNQRSYNQRRHRRDASEKLGLISIRWAFCTIAAGGGATGSTRPPPIALRSGRKVLLPVTRNARAGHLNEDRWPRCLGSVLGVHVNLPRQAVALSSVAGCAGGDDVLPDRLAAAAAGDHVVDGEAGFARAAVLTGPGVAGEDGAAGDLAAVGFAGDPHVVDEADHVGAIHRHVLGVDCPLAALQ